MSSVNVDRLKIYGIYIDINETTTANGVIERKTMRHNELNQSYLIEWLRLPSAKFRYMYAADLGPSLRLNYASRTQPTALFKLI